jgi:hypothetical protein
MAHGVPAVYRAIPITIALASVGPKSDLITLASGFGSARRFNAVFAEVYRGRPSDNHELPATP